jgi:hypothetical protein
MIYMQDTIPFNMYIKRGLFGVSNLYEGPDAGLQDKGGVEEERVKKGMRVGGKLSQKAGKLQIHVQTVLGHMFKL